MKKFIEEFKEFAFKGNIVDLAVAVVMGAAFNGVITGFVNHIINPLIGVFGGTAGLSGIKLWVFEIGDFVGILINFMIQAFAIFLAIKAYNALKKQPKEEVVEEVAPAVNEELETLKQILAELKNK